MYQTEMLPLLGMLVVFCSVAGGFALENGRFAALIHPSEVVIIGGAAVGTLLAANTPGVLRETLRELLRVFRRPAVTKESYLSGLVLLQALFTYGRRNGAAMLEELVDDPVHGSVFRRHAGALPSPGALAFVCDTLRLISLARLSPPDLDAMLDQDVESQVAVLDASGNTLDVLADALPGLGILSAVLGVIITMGSIRDLPQVIGQKVGGALAGTFLGIFLSYGFVAPLATHLKMLSAAEAQFYRTLRAGLGAFGKGMPVSIAMEFARRHIPPDLRPSFHAMEAEFRTATVRHEPGNHNPVRIFRFHATKTPI